MNGQSQVSEVDWELLGLPSEGATRLEVEQAYQRRVLARERIIQYLSASEEPDGPMYKFQPRTDNVDLIPRDPVRFVLWFLGFLFTGVHLMLTIAVDTVRSHPELFISCLVIAAALSSIYFIVVYTWRVIGWAFTLLASSIHQLLCT